MDQYLHLSSHQPAQLKIGVASCLFHRARTMTTRDNIEKEVEHLSVVLRTNGYPNLVTNTAIKKRQQKEPPRYTVCLLYVEGVKV